MRRTTMGILAAMMASAPGAAQAPGPPALTWPVACKVGETCFVQNYVDLDPSPGARDFTCGGRTYNGHGGVDIRLPDLAAQRRGVDVLAAADGRVFGVRDGVADVSVRAAGEAAVEAVECGNRIFVAHPGGVNTGYCHLAKGSVAVKDGDVVKAGQRIGRVGMSGLTEYPHLHFAVSEGPRHIEPFAYGAAAGSCRAGRSLWAATPPYEERTVINTGFAAEQLSMERIEAGAIAPPAAGAPVMLAYVRAIGLRRGDVQALTLRGPDGAVLRQDTAEPLPRDQAQRVMFGGIRTPAGGWKRGRYEATYLVSAGGKVVLTRRFAMTL